MWTVVWCEEADGGEDSVDRWEQYHNKESVIKQLKVLQERLRGDMRNVIVFPPKTMLHPEDMLNIQAP